MTMKKYLAMAKAAAAALGLLFFAACVNNFLDTPQPRIAEGKGVVRVGTGAGSERTALPSGGFDRWEYLFAKDGGTPEPMTPSADQGGEKFFELDSVGWTLTVRAYMGSGPEVLAAEGSADFAISGGEETQVRVWLLPVASDGTGTLDYALSYPATAAAGSFTLTLFADDTPANLTGTSTTENNITTLTGSASPASGYYLVRAKVTKGSITLEKGEVAHIYKDMTTTLALEFTEDDFKALVVVSGADSGPGTLRQALADVPGGGTILIDLPEYDRVITLTGTLPAITKTLTLEGNGATLTQSGVSAPLMSFGQSTGTVTIRRLHFKGGNNPGAGGAIYNTTSNFGRSTHLTLESCIFSDNRAAGNGGAIMIYGANSTVKISGCTFYGNTAGTAGGAVYRSTDYPDNSITLTGNVFWGNAAPSFSVVYDAAKVSNKLNSGGFNVSDKASGTDAASGSGWVFAETDKTAGSHPVGSVSFRPLAGGAAVNVIDVRPGGYPEADFYGDPVPESNAAAGAAQAQVKAGYVLDISHAGPGTIVPIDTANADGVWSPGSIVNLKAVPAANGVFGYWTVNGQRQTEQTTPDELALTMEGHTSLGAVFYHRVSDAGDAGTGTLRDALSNVVDGGGIIFSENLTITISAVLPSITKTIFIEGKGSTLTQSGIAAGADTQLLRITSATANVRISRLHFTGGSATGNGGAIQNLGNLTLESCVLSNNSAGNGGGVYSSGSITVLGSAFSGNTAVTSGGAIHNAGTANLTGNVFQGNTAPSFSVANAAASWGYNVSDKADGADAASGSGWTFVNGDKQTTSLAVSSISFKPIKGVANGVEGVIPARPDSYPAADFYGVAITYPAAAGAVQTPTEGTGFVLNYSSAQENRGTVTQLDGATPDSDGLIAGNSSVTLKAVPDNGGISSSFWYWIVDGERLPDQPTPDQLVLTISGHTSVRAVFCLAVTGSGDSGPGTLRAALTSAMAGSGGDRIAINLQGSDQVITLSAVLPQITKSVTIEGNGATLTRSFATNSATSQLLYVNSNSAEVRISRLHFKGGRATNNGAAIRSTGGPLTLESCIFSDNLTSNASANGGAIYTTGNITVSGCTFTGNTAGTTGGNGGAILVTNGALTLTGNLFWANTAVNYSVVRKTSGPVTNGGHNVSDKPDGTTSAQSGWDFHASDTQAASLPFHTSDFRPLSTGAAYQRIDARPNGYPVLDFYGTPIPSSNAMAGAVQTAIVVSGGYYVLDYGAEGPGEVTGVSGTGDSGMYTGSVTLSVSPASASSKFVGWTVNGVAQAEQSTTLSLTMDGHKTVRALFATMWQVTSGANDGDGSLRTALASAVAGDYIVFQQGLTVTLGAVLPDITKNLTIEGNGATLTRSFASGGSTQLLRVSGATTTVRISRLHFKSGRATDEGAAIKNTGNLTLESCVFSDNITSMSMAYGGAIYTTTGSLTVLGCTFTGNATTQTNGQGAAIYRAGGTLVLTGNVFTGNTAQYPVVYGGGSFTTTNGYNVSDKASGTGAGTSGWTFSADPADIQLTDLAFDADFKPSSATSLTIIPALPSGFPATYFDGTPRGSDSTPGAMPAQTGS